MNPVPAPVQVTIASDPISPIRPVGSDVGLTCAVNMLSSAVDVSVVLSTLWMGPSYSGATATSISMRSLPRIGKTLRPSIGSVGTSLRFSSQLGGTGTKATV